MSTSRAQAHGRIGNWYLHIDHCLFRCSKLHLRNHFASLARAAEELAGFLHRETQKVAYIQCGPNAECLYVLARQQQPSTRVRTAFQRPD